jgi:hypothetical protein
MQGRHYTECSKQISERGTFSIQFETDFIENFYIF